MPSISLTNPVSGTVVAAGLHTTNLTALQTLLNGGLDNANLASAAALSFSKLGSLASAQAGDVPVWNGTAWVRPTGTPSVNTFLNGAGAWESITPQTYTPTWTAVSSNPAIGNGTISGTYIKFGKFVIAEVNITAGSTTTFGTGAWQLTVPFSPNSLGHGNGLTHMYDSSATAHYFGYTIDSGGTSTTYILYLPQGATAAATVTNTVPFTWATGDTLRWTISYLAN